jgi:hypothetical protein
MEFLRDITAEPPAHSNTDILPNPEKVGSEGTRAGTMGGSDQRHRTRHEERLRHPQQSAAEEQHPRCRGEASQHRYSAEENQTPGHQLAFGVAISNLAGDGIAQGIDPKKDRSSQPELKICELQICLQHGEN